MSNVTLWKSNLTGPAAITCSCGHKYDGSGGVPRCPSCNAITATEAAGKTLIDRAKASAQATGVPFQKALDEECRRDPALYARHREEVKSETKRAAMPTAEEARDEGRRLNGRPASDGECPRCRVALRADHGRFCASCGCELPAVKAARPAPAPRMSPAQALIEAAVDVIVAKANTSRQVALDAFMKTARGRELYAEHVAAINGDCS